MRSALRMMCRIAQNDGTIPYGLRASKLAELCEYSVATTIHRAECYLIEHGYIERVRKAAGASESLADRGRQARPGRRQATRTSPATRACKRS